jgi:hypothetical protein
VEEYLAASGQWQKDFAAELALRIQDSIAATLVMVLA